MADLYFVRYNHESPWPVDAPNPQKFEALNWYRDGAIPFIPHVGMFLDVGDGELRTVEAVYWWEKTPSKIEVDLSDGEVPLKLEYYERSGWKTHELKPTRRAKGGRRGR